MPEEVKVGDVAYVKSTSEPVFVTGEVILKDPTFPREVQVRRPINTRDGIQHQTEHFLLVELETYKDKVDREVAELQYGRDLVLATKAGHSTPVKAVEN